MAKSSSAIDMPGKIARVAGSGLGRAAASTQAQAGAKVAGSRIAWHIYAQGETVILPAELGMVLRTESAFLLQEPGLA